MKIKNNKAKLSEIMVKILVVFLIVFLAFVIFSNMGKNFFDTIGIDGSSQGSTSSDYLNSDAGNDDSIVGSEPINTIPSSYSYSDLTGRFDKIYNRIGTLKKASSGGGKINPARIVLHHTGGDSWESAESAMKSRGLGVHYTLAKDGTIIVYGEPTDRFSHACGANYETIGIEIVNTGYKEFTEEQYQTLKEFIPYLESMLTNKKEPSVIGHFEVDELYSDEFQSSGCDLGKWDPNPSFDWTKVGYPRNDERLRKLCDDAPNDFTISCYIS